MFTAHVLLSEERYQQRQLLRQLLQKRQQAQQCQLLQKKRWVAAEAADSNIIISNLLLHGMIVSVYMHALSCF